MENTATITYSKSEKLQNVLYPKITFDKPVGLEDFITGLFSAAEKMPHIDACTFVPMLFFALRKREMGYNRMTQRGSGAILHSGTKLLIKTGHRWSKYVASQGKFGFLTETFEFDGLLDQADDKELKVGQYYGEGVNNFMKLFAEGLVSELGYTLREEEPIAA